MVNIEFEVSTKFLNRNVQYAVVDIGLELRISPETWTGILDLGSIDTPVVIKALGVIEILQKEYMKGEEKSTKGRLLGNNMNI